MLLNPERAPALISKWQKLLGKDLEKIVVEYTAEGVSVELFGLEKTPYHNKGDALNVAEYRNLKAKESAPSNEDAKFAFKNKFEVRLNQEFPQAVDLGDGSEAALRRAVQALPFDQRRVMLMSNKQFRTAYPNGFAGARSRSLIPSIRDKVFFYGRQAPVGSATGTWPRLDGAPTPTSPESKSYDRNRRKMAKFLGLDCLFTQREYFQSLQTDSTGTRVLVNSNKVGDLLVVKPVPQTLDKPWFKGKFRFPREYLGIPNIENRIKKLSYLLHIVTQSGIPSLTVLKRLKRLSLTWFSVRYTDLRNQIRAITFEMQRLGAMTRNPSVCHKALHYFPTFVGVKNHENGIKVPLWTRPAVKAG